MIDPALVSKNLVPELGIPVGVLNPDPVAIEKSGVCGIEVLIQARFEDAGFEPASRMLRSKHDEQVGHQRRYGRHDLEPALRAAGLEVEYTTHFFCALFFPVFLARVVPYRLGLAPRQSRGLKRREHRPVGSFSGRVLPSLLAREVHAANSLRTSRIGTSILAVARKR